RLCHVLLPHAVHGRDLLGVCLYFGRGAFLRFMSVMRRAGVPMIDESLSYFTQAIHRRKPKPVQPRRRHPVARLPALCPFGGRRFLPLRFPLRRVRVDRHVTAPPNQCLRSRNIRPTYRQTSSRRPPVRAPCPAPTPPTARTYHLTMLTPA